MVRKKGIDVSFWNGRLTEKQYKRIKREDIDFVIARAGGYRGTVTDGMFNNNYKQAKAAGLDFGAYYYSTSVNTRQAKLEARHAVRLCRGKRLDYPIWMDVEDAMTQGRLSKTALTRVIKAFVKEVRRLGYRCGVYASFYWLSEKIGNLSGIDVWVAQYASHTNYRRPAMWQFSDDGQFSGVPGRFDLNWCYKDYTRDDRPDDEKPDEPDDSCDQKEGYPGPLSLPFRGYFKRGDKGRKVRELQRFLNWCGRDLRVDGVYGDKTIAAVKWFERKYGLYVDGLFGRECLKKAKSLRK